MIRGSDTALEHLAPRSSDAESLFLLRHTFSSLIQWALFASGDYLRGLLGRDMRPAYNHLRSLLQALQWQSPGGPWVLETGQHRWGRHIYSLEPFVVEADHIRTRYAEYTSRFIESGENQRTRSQSRDSLGLTLLWKPAEGAGPCSGAPQRG